MWLTDLKWFIFIYLSSSDQCYILFDEANLLNFIKLVADFCFTKTKEHLNNL